MLLDTSHLADIRRCVQDLMDWEGLGVELNLDFLLIERIGKDKGGVVSKCKTEILCSWLRTEKPTKSSLVAALRRMGENAIADTIK